MTDQDQIDGQADVGRGPINDQRPALPGYSIRRKLNDSPDAVTWEALQLSLDRVVAVKVLKPSLLRDRDRCNRFITQTRAVARLKHPAVIQVYDVEQHDDICYVVTEHIEGDSLEASLQRGGAQSPRATLYTVRSLAELLDEAWRALGIAHGGIDPRTIVFDRDGAVKLAELGMTGVYRASPGREQALSYQAPECDEPGREPDCRSDMYALGAVMYHMLTGRKPFDGLARDADGQIRRGELASPRDLDAGLAAGPVQLLRRLMMKDPAERYADWGAVLADLRKVESGKMLVVKSRQPGVLPTGSAEKPEIKVQATGGKAPLRLRSRSVAAFAAAPRPSRYTGLRVILWIVLFAWWGGLTWYLLELPPRTELRRPAPQPLAAPGRAAPPTAAELPPTAEPPREAEPVDRSPPRVAAMPPSRSAPPEAARPTPAPASPPRETVMPGRAALDPVAVALLNEDTAMARQRLRAVRERFDSTGATRLLDEVESIVEAVEGMEAAVLAAFNRRRGERIDMHFAGQRQTVVVRGVEGGGVLVDIVTGRADAPVLRPQRIPVSLLGPDERLRLLGSPSSSADAAIHFLLRMEAGDFLTAREQAAGCGPLAAAFADAAEQRMRVLMQ